MPRDAVSIASFHSNFRRSILVLRKNISRRTVSTERFDYNWSESGWVSSGVTKSESVKTRRTRSDIVPSDGRKPTSYEELMVTTTPGDYFSRSATIYSKGQYSSPLNICVFPFVRNLTSGNPSSCIVMPDSSYLDPGLIEALASAAKTDFNAAQALAESRKTAETITSLTRTLYRDLIAIKKLDFKYLRKRFSLRNKQKSKSDFSSPAEGWLMYRYGIMPTVYDIQSAVKVLNDDIVRKLTVNVRGGTKFDLSADYKDYYDYRHNVRTGSGVARTNLTLKIDSPLYQTANEFGFANIPGIGWELIPLSFIVDWALPIGPWLQALSVLPNVSFMHGSQSWQFQGSLNIDYDEELYWYDFTRWSASYTLTGYRRRVLSRLPIPLPRLQNPIRGIGDLDRVADLLSLADVLTRK